MAGSRSRDVAILLRTGAKFAAGFGTAQGAPDVSAGAIQATLPSIGERLRSGFSAISPEFQEFEESRAEIGQRGAQTGLIMEQRKQLQVEQEQLNKPFDIRNLVGVADPGGNLGKAVETELTRIGADIDGNGVITQGELNKALNSGKIDFSTIDTAFGNAIKSSDVDVAAKRATFKTKLDAINKKQIEAGQKPFSESDFQDPSFRATFSAEAIEFDKITSAEQRNAMLKERQKMVGRFAQQQTGDTGEVPFAKTVDQLKALEAQRIATETGREPIEVLREIERSLDPGLVEQTAADFNIDLKTASDEEWEVIAASIAKNNFQLAGILTGEFLKNQYQQSVQGITVTDENDPLGLR